MRLPGPLDPEKARSIRSFVTPRFQGPKRAGVRGSIQPGSKDVFSDIFGNFFGPAAAVRALESDAARSVATTSKSKFEKLALGA